LLTRSQPSRPAVLRADSSTTSESHWRASKLSILYSQLGAEAALSRGCGGKNNESTNNKKQLINRGGSITVLLFASLMPIQKNEINCRSCKTAMLQMETNVERICG